MADVRQHWSTYGEISLKNTDILAAGSRSQVAAGDDGFRGAVSLLRVSQGSRLPPIAFENKSGLTWNSMRLA